MTKTMANRIQPPTQSRWNHRHYPSNRRRLTSFASTSILSSFRRCTRFGHPPAFLCPGIARDLFHHEVVGQGERSRNKHPIHQHAHLVDKWNNAVEFVAEKTQDREAAGEKIAQDPHRISERKTVGDRWDTETDPFRICKAESMK